MSQLSKPLIKNGRSLLLLTALLHKSYINTNKQGFPGICHETHVTVGHLWKWCMFMLYSDKVKWVYNPTTNSNLAHGCVCVCHGTEFYFIQVSASLNMVQVFYVTCDHASWQILIIKPTRCTNFSNLFWNKTLHVSDSSSVHHQQFFTVHTAMVYVIQLVSSRIRTELQFCPDPARKLSANMYDIYHCCVYSEKLLRNM